MSNQTTFLSKNICYLFSSLLSYHIFNFISPCERKRNTWEDNTSTIKLEAAQGRITCSLLPYLLPFHRGFSSKVPIKKSCRQPTAHTLLSCELKYWHYRNKTSCLQIDRKPHTHLTAERGWTSARVRLSSEPIQNLVQC